MVALPFVIVPVWHDAYYLPKIWVLYIVVGLGAVQAFRLEGAAWLRCIGTPLGRALAAWLAALAISTALSVNPWRSAVGADYRYEGLSTWLAYGVLAALAARALRPPRHLATTLAATLAAAGAIAVLALVRHWGFPLAPGDAARAGWARAWDTVGGPPALGAYLVLLLPLVLGLFAAEERFPHYLAYGALAVLSYAALVATLARGSWAALVVGVVAWAIAGGRVRLRAAAGRLVVIAALCAAITPAVLVTGRPGAVGHISDISGAASSAFLWRSTTPLVVRRPWFGWGPETLAETYPAYGTPEFAARLPAAATQGAIVDRPRNHLLQQAAATGLVGLAAYVWLCYTLLGAAWRTARARAYGDRGLRRANDTWSPLVDPNVVGAGLFGGFAAYLAQLQLSFNYVGVAPVFWALVGAAAALRPRVALVAPQRVALGLRRGTARV